MTKKEVAVIHHNDLNKLNLNSLNKREIDIFFSLISQLKDKNDNTIKFYWDDLKVLGEFTNKSNADFKNVLVKLSENLANITYFVEDETTAEIIPIFQRFTIYKEDYTLEVKFNEDMLYLLNNLSSQYSNYDLKTLVSLKSRYAQQLFRYLKQYKATGFWRVSLEDFKKFMGTPPSYNFAKVREKVITPSFNELESIFNNLELKTFKGKGKESRKIVKLEFTFDKESKSRNRVDYNNRIQEYIVIDGVKYKRVVDDLSLEDNPMIQKGIDAEYHKKMWNLMNSEL